MQKNYDYKHSNFYNQCVENEKSPTINVIIKDLFCKNSVYSESDINGNVKKLFENMPIILSKDKKVNKRSQVFILFPEELIGFSENDISETTRNKISTFINYEAKNSMDKNNTIGRRIEAEYRKNPKATLKMMENHIKTLFQRNDLIFDKEILRTYLFQIKEKIVLITPMENFSQQASKNTNNTDDIELENVFKKLSLDTFDTLVNLDCLDIVLSRILISIVIGSLIKNAAGVKQEYGLTKECLMNIWIRSGYIKLHDHIEPADYKHLSFREIFICAIQWFSENKYYKSFEILNNAIKTQTFKKYDNLIEKQEIIYLYSIHILKNHVNSDISLNEIIANLKECISHRDAQYELCNYYQGMYDANVKELNTASHHLRTASELGHIQATLELATHCINQSEVYIEFIKIKENTISNNYEQAKQLLKNIKKESCTKSQLSTFYYLTGLILEHEHSEKADACFKKAYDLGHSEAVKKIRFKKMDKHINIKKELLNSSRTKILTNSLTDKFTTNFLRTHSNVNIYTTDIKNSNNSINRIENIRAFIKEAAIHNNANPSTSTTDSYNVFFFADDEEKNLYDTLELLEELYNTVMEMDISLRRKIIDSFDIFLKCNYEHASMFIDATLNKMLENTYFKVHICDPDRDAAHELLYNIPLFTPLIMETNSSIESNLQKANCNVVIFSNSNFSQTLAKEIVALGYMGEKYPVTLSIIGDNATVSEEQFFCNLPGLYKCQQQLFTSTITNSKPKCIIPRFYESTLARLNLSSVISSRENPLNEIVTSGNYFIVDVGNDFQNIQFAISLRRELLKSTNDFDNAPLITIKCRDSKAAYAVDNAVLDNKPQGNEFWNKYDFRFFGMLDSLYSYENLVLNNTLEDLSCEIHCCYDEEAFNNEEKTMEVLKNYYSSQYNQDSSKITAIGLRYRLFVADLYEAPQNYEPLIFSIEKDQGLSKQYKSWLDSKDENNEYLAGSIEQTRWNGFMLSRGWEPASLNQVVGYKNQPSNGQHKHMIAKLHPFIREWEDLDEMDDDSFIVSLRNKFTQDSRTQKYKIENPKETTLKSVRDTAKMLSLKHMHQIKESSYKEDER